MPSFSQYQKIVVPQNNNMARKLGSDELMDATWWEDIGSRVAYIYDYYHDDEPLKLRNLHPEKSKTKTPVDIKYLVNAYNSENKDQVGYHLQFRPGHTCPLDYYEEKFEDKYDAEYPIGLYCDIPDERGIYRKWLITENANQLNTQFPTYYILPCDHVFNWIYKGVMYKMAGVSRSQSSYNSGEWTDYVFTTVENQRKCILPMNDISTTLFYNQRIVLSAPIEQPVVWHCSKVEQTAPKGVSRITFAQETWNAEFDAFEYLNDDGKTTEFSSEYDSSRKIVNMWCDYFKTSVAPKEDNDVIPVSPITAKLSYSGLAAEIKPGGSYKKITINHFKNNEPISYSPTKTSWSFKLYFPNKPDTIIDPVETGLITVKFSEDSSDLSDNQIKVKFVGGGEYSKGVLVITNTDTNLITDTIELAIVSL